MEQIQISFDTRRYKNLLNEILVSIKNDIPKVINKNANDLRNESTDELKGKTTIEPKVVEDGIEITKADRKNKRAIISYSSKPVPIEHYNPQYHIHSKTQGSVQVDYYMNQGSKVLSNGVFFNPKANKIRRRITQHSYPIKRVYGPSVANLFEKVSKSLIKEVKNNLKKDIASLIT